jgi:hypothetical protein
VRRYGLATQSNQIKVEILEKVQATPFDGREFGLPWSEQANAALQLNYRYATMYIRGSLTSFVANGWSCRGVDYGLRGWHFSDGLQDAESETLSFRHLITFPKDVSIVYFLKLEFKPESYYWMLDVVQAVRDYIEINE